MALPFWMETTRRCMYAWGKPQFSRVQVGRLKSTAAGRGRAGGNADGKEERVGACRVDRSGEAGTWLQDCSFLIEHGHQPSLGARGLADPTAW